MGSKPQYAFEVEFPGDLEYIPAIRKYISEILQCRRFDNKFAYRSEIIIDELCNNAVSYGCTSLSATITLSCTIFDDHAEFEVRDQGSTKENIKKLDKAVKSGPKSINFDDYSAKAKNCLGLEIVRMLSHDLSYAVNDKKLTCVKVVKHREEAAAAAEQKETP